MKSLVEGEKLLDGGTVREVEDVAGTADDFAQTAEEKDADTRGWGGSGHEEIVARERGSKEVRKQGNQGMSKGAV